MAESELNFKRLTFIDSWRKGRLTDPALLTAEERFNFFEGAFRASKGSDGSTKLEDRPDPIALLDGVSKMELGYEGSSYEELFYLLTASLRYPSSDLVEVIRSKRPENQVAYREGYGVHKIFSEALGEVIKLELPEEKFGDVVIVPKGYIPTRPFEFSDSQFRYLIDKVLNGVGFLRSDTKTVISIPRRDERFGI